jgi:adhesin/invasin
VTVSGSGTGLNSGANTITAVYGGDTSHNPATASVSLTIVGLSSGTPFISGATNAASYQQSYAPGMAMAIFGTQLALTTNTASTLPLPTVLDNVSVTVNEVAAPLYYISPTQLNVQIPYETPISEKVTVVVSNNGQTASTTIQVSAAAPGIFFDNSTGALLLTATATRGQTIALYLTGAGAVQPSVATGAIPSGSASPAPAQQTLVTVGGVEASITYIGIPTWSVGVLQVNFIVPSTAALGPQSVVVSVGEVASAGVTLTVSQ